jgi:ABC-2 type transport system ATP-binding protein
VYPKQASGELAWTIVNLATEEKWRLGELHTEEGRLDEVFRNITLPDTTAEKSR